MAAGGCGLPVGQRRGGGGGGARTVYDGPGAT